MTGIAEPVACLSHLISGVVFCLVVLGLLPRIRRCPRRRLAYLGYVFGVGGMFFASGAYHMVGHEHPLRGLLWFLDHGMIWFAIAGTGSLFVVVWGWTPRARITLVAMWAMAISGLILENLFLRDLAPWVSPLLYIAMGWVGAYPVFEIAKAEGLVFTLPILAGGATSTLGGIVDAIELPNLLPRVIEAHEVMHALIALGMFLFLWGQFRCLAHFDAQTTTKPPLGEEPARIASFGGVEAHFVPPAAE